MNDLEKLILAYPEKEWDWISLTENLAISLKFIINHIEYPWDFINLTHKYSIDRLIPIILSNLDKKWDWGWISNSNKLPLDFIEKCKNYLDYNALSEHVDLDFIMKHQNYSWYWSKISDRKDLKLSQHVLNNPDLNWDWNKLSLNPYINSDVVEKLIYKPWNWSLLSLNISMDWEFIEKYIDKPWDWQKLSFSLITTWDIIINNLNNKRIKWDWISICLHNPNITFKHVIEHPELPWNFRLLSQNRMGYSYKIYDYDVLTLDILLLKILSNKSLPDYLQMEILINDHFRFTEYEIFSLL